MADVILCPHCKKRLPVRLLAGVAIVYCRFCKREITVSAEDAA